LWRKRYFRLYKKEGSMAYFKSDKETEQIGEISVTGAFLIEKRDDLGKFCFTITMKTTARVWILQATDEATMDQWIAACTPLMKETAAVKATGGKKPPKPKPGLPLKFPPKYVQGWAEIEDCPATLQDGEMDWTGLTSTKAEQTELADGQVALTVHGSNAVVEEVREVTLDGNKEAWLDNVPKQLKYSAASIGWSSGDSQIVQTRFHYDEKTQRDLLNKLVGQKISASVPGNGHGHGEDHGKREEQRTTGSKADASESEHHGQDKSGGVLAFPADVKFTGVLHYHKNDDRYALVDEDNNAVHFLNTRDAHTISLEGVDRATLNEGTNSVFAEPRLWTRFEAGGDKTLGQLTYSLQNAFELFVNYSVTFSPDESVADVTGWYSVHNKTSKTYENASLGVVPAAKKPEEVDEEDGEKSLGEEAKEIAEEEAKGKVKSKLGGFAALLPFGKKDEEEKPKDPRLYHFPVVQNATLPAYDWAHVAFLSKRVEAATLHLVTFDTPRYAIKPIVDQAAGTDAAVEIFTVARFSNPLTAAIPSGTARIARRERSGHGIRKVGKTGTISRVEGGEEVTLRLAEADGISCSRTQIGLNLDADKNFLIEQLEFNVANGRQQTVEVVVEESLFRWQDCEVTHSSPAHQPTSHPRRIQWKVRLNSGEDQKIKATIFYSNFELPSDYEDPDE